MNFFNNISKMEQYYFRFFSMGSYKNYYTFSMKTFFNKIKHNNYKMFAFWK